jgi:3'5'-cyclic nucleotide phosphodiesterase
VLTRLQHPACDVHSSDRPKFIPISTLDSNHAEDASEEGSVWGDDDDDLTDSINVLVFPECHVQQQFDRLIDWQVELFSKLLRQVVAGRDRTSVDIQSMQDPSKIINCSGPVFEEVSESIELPKFDPKAATARARPSFVELPQQVVTELRNYIRAISLRYRQNPFHNYAHASHVVQSANKLLARIVRPDDVNYHRKSVKAIASDLHDYTFGITSDPLTHFAILFATLIHDVDHTGVSNAQRSKEEPHLSEKYKNKSVAEQNSVDLAWSLLMHEDHKGLQRCIFATEAELKRFRQLVVNLVCRVSRACVDYHMSSTKGITHIGCFCLPQGHGNRYIRTGNESNEKRTMG